MTFNSFNFLVFFPIVIAIYYVIPKKLRKYWLLVASYYFYMSWNALYAVLIVTSTVVTYLSGILIGKTEIKKKRKWIVAGSFIINLSILFFFKYWGFLIDNVNMLISKSGVVLNNNPFSLLLPVGISFYTFQALGYTVDVYRGDIEPEKNFVNYALFVSFFPQLVAGPIERSGNLLKQVKKVSEEKLFSYEGAVKGFSLMCYGMFLKVVVADNISVFVDGVWNNLQKAGMSACVIAAIAFSLQIYCDFSGYSTIAIGAAKMMGFDLMDNFNTPYFADSISEFWRRWHISLSTWFKDYLYIPLGGSRCSRIKKYRNLMITFLVSGLWHGADWTYVIWGGIHGIYQVVGDATKGFKKKANNLLKVCTDNFSFSFGRIVVTFALTTFAWIFFRAKTLKDALLFIKNMVKRPDPWALFDGSLYGYGIDRVDFHVVFVGIMVLILVDLLRYIKKIDIGTFLFKQNLWFRWICLIVLILGCLVYGGYGVNFSSAQFIYFQF